MTPLFKKHNFTKQKSIVILNAPEEFKLAMYEMKAFTEILVEIPTDEALSLAIVFLQEKQEIEIVINSLIPLLIGDSILWFAYPKASSKKYITDFNRDNGWDAMKGLGWEGVRQVAIDEDWTALRFKNWITLKR